MKNIKHFVYVFDLDNTLIKTNKANNISYREAVKTVVGIDLEMSRNSRFTRRKLADVLPNLKTEEARQIVALKEQLFQKYLSITILNKNLFQILTLLSRSEEVMLLTDSRENRAKQLLNYYNLELLFLKRYYHENLSGLNKYQFLENTLGIDKTQVVLFENDFVEKNRAAKNGILSNQIIKVKF